MIEISFIENLDHEQLRGHTIFKRFLNNRVLV